MQKGPQATFKGHVRRGFDNWKKGRVDFTVEADSGSWTVQLFHDVNPNRVVHRYKSLLGKSASIIFKCSRLIIGDKRDGELHIKIPDHEAVNAERLVKKITSYSVNTPNHNRAEVGLTSSRNGISSSDGNVSKVSNLPKTEGWLSKKTPPPSFQQKHHASSAKRKIQLDFTDQGACKSSNVSRAERQSRLVNGDCYVIDGDEDDEEVTFPHFTGMKDYSKSCKDAVVNNGKGLGPVNFYGADKSLMAENAYRGLNRKPASSNSPSQHNGLRSPKVKRPKLSDIDDADRENKIEVSASSKALLKGALCNRMAGKTPTLSDPQEVVVSGGSQNDEHAASLDASGHNGDGHMVGFDNLGNTCFMNSPLQCLSSLEPLSLDIQSAISKFGPQLPPNSITKMLYLLMKDVRKLDVRPERVREILTRLRHDINGKFEYNTQQDAHELLAELLDRTDEEVKALLSNTNGKVDSPTLSPNSPSTSVNANDENAENQEASKVLSTGDMLKSTPTEANFTWFYKTSFFFHECKTEVVSSQDERDTTLMLALDSKTSMNLQDCIDNYFESSEVDMRCEKCGKEEKATMTRKIVKRPRCFILNLLRYHTHNLEAKKKLDRVSIPRYMSVVEFCAEDVKAAPAIEPVFMLDREKNLPLSDLDKGEGASLIPCSEKHRSSELDEIELKSNESKPLPELPPLRRPEELSSEIQGKKKEENKPTSRCRPLSSKEKHVLHPGESTPEKAHRPALLPTPPSDEECQIVPSKARPHSQPSCSSPKSHQGQLYLSDCLPVTPIMYDQTGVTDIDGCKDRGAKTFTSRSIEECLMTPLTIDVDLQREPRKRNPAGDQREAHLTVNDYREALANVPDMDEVTYINLGAHFVPPCENEVELPYDASLPVESANGAQMMYTPAVEAAKCGHAIALTKACEERRKIAVSESKRCTSPGQVETKAVETSDNLDTTREDVRKNGANGQAHDEKEQNLDPAEQERLTIKRLANHLADQFAEVEQHIEMAREAQEDFSDIYTEAQNTIVTMSGHVKNFMEQNYELEEGETRESNAYKMAEQNTLCEVLIERALVGDEESDEEFDYPRVRKRLIALRYRSVHGEAAQMNHLINDLAMYLAAKEVGVVVEPDTPKRQKISCVGSSGGPYKGNSTLDHSCKCEKEVKRNSFDGEDKAECTSHGEVFMEEDSGNRGSIEVNLSGVNSRTSSAGDGESESWTKDKATQVGRENHNNRKGKSGVSEKNSLGGQKSQADSSKVETTEEESSGGLADVSHNATINTTNGFNSSMYDPGFLGDGMDKSLMDVPLLLGRPVSEWSEQELHDVELGALSEEDMMTYAQALSRLEYEREQINHTVSTSVASTAVIDSNTYSDIMDSCEEMTAVSYISTSSAQEKERLDCANKYPGEVSSTSGSSLSEGSDTERAASKLTSPEGKPNSNNKSGLHVDKGKTPSKLPELHCEESLSDIDEPDGMKDDSDVFKVKGLKGGQAGSNSCLSPSSSNTRSRSRLSSNERTCKSCGQVRNKNKHCSPCKASPTLSSMDSGKVLSPHKGLSNHANTLVQSNKTSRVQSSERNPQNPPHGNQSPRLQSISPAVSSLSSSSSGSGGGKSNLNSRDIHMLSPSMSQLSPRKDACSVSHSKSARNELARLRSPSSASPRKRLCKESGSASSQGGRAKLGSASKRLLFEDESGNNNRVQSHVKRTLASEDASTGLIDKRTSVANNLLENYPMQEDLIGGSLAKSEDGELADPDGIHKLLSASKSDKSSSSLLCQISSSKSKSGLDDDQTISIISNPSNIPHPVPVAGSRHNVANSVKMEPSSHSPSSKSQLTQILSPSTFREEGNQKQAVTLKSIMESAASGDEDYADGENADPVHTSTKPKSHRQQLSLNDEKENIVESGTRRERLDNIEMGKADCSYRLVGIVNHHGESLFAGHYTAFSFNFNKQRWFFMDDKHTRGTVETTARAESANSGYVFFYMDKDIFDKYAQKVSERPPKRGSTNC